MWWMPLVMAAASAVQKSNAEKEERQLSLNSTLDNIRQKHADSYGGGNYGKFVSQMVQRDAERERNSSNGIGTVIQGLNGSGAFNSGSSKDPDVDNYHRALADEANAVNSSHNDALGFGESSPMTHNDPWDDTEFNLL